jgi:hypothetical protein
MSALQQPKQKQASHGKSSRSVRATTSVSHAPPFAVWTQQQRRRTRNRCSGPADNDVERAIIALQNAEGSVVYTDYHWRSRRLAYDECRGGATVVACVHNPANVRIWPYTLYVTLFALAFRLSSTCTLTSLVAFTGTSRWLSDSSPNSG